MKLDLDPRPLIRPFPCAMPGSPDQESTVIALILFCFHSVDSNFFRERNASIPLAGKNRPIICQNKPSIYMFLIFLAREVVVYFFFDKNIN